MFSILQSPSQIIQINPALETLFVRYQIDSTSNHPINEHLDCADLLVRLCEQLTEIEKCSAEDFRQFSLLELVDFLGRSHNYYRSKKIPELNQRICNLINATLSHQKNLIAALHYFDEYTQHLVEHFEEEELHLFPLASIAEKPKTFETKNEILNRFEFVEQHSVQHDSINSNQYYELISKCLELTTTSPDISMYLNIIKDQLISFKEDIELHEWFEESVFIPRLKRHFSVIEPN